MSKLEAWLGEQTTIQGLMCAAGGVGYWAVSGDWKIAAVLLGVGTIGLVLRETPSQVMGQVGALLAQAQQMQALAKSFATDAFTAARMPQGFPPSAPPAAAPETDQAPPRQR